MPQNRKNRPLALVCCLCLLPAALLFGCEAGAGRVPPASSEVLAAPEAIDLARPEGGLLDLAYLTGQQNGAPPPARPGDEMAEQDLIDTAKDLLLRADAFYSWAWEPEAWALDTAAPLAEVWYGKPCTLCPLLDFADEAQLRAVYASIFSEEGLRRQEERFRQIQQDFPEAEYGRPPFCTRQGRLYANPTASPSRYSTRCDPRTLRLVGASADTAVLEAEQVFEDGQPMGQGMSITLLRQNGRWVLAGPLWDMPLDNRFVPLPEDLAVLAQKLDADDPDAAFRLRQAARLGRELTAGDAAGVNRCMIDRGGEPPIYDAAGYAFADLTGLAVSGWEVKYEEGEAQSSGQAQPKIWLRLAVDSPGSTGLRGGDEWYQVGFHTGGDSSFARGCIASLRPEGEVLAVDEALAAEAGRQTTLLRWFLGRDAFEGLAGEEPLRLLSYCAARLRWEKLTDEHSGFTQEQLDALAADLGLEEGIFSEELMLGDDYTLQNGRWYPPGRDGYGPGGPEKESRFAALRREGDTITAALRFYRDAQCLMPAYDLIYTFAVSPAGRWLPVRCERVDAAA